MIKLTIALICVGFVLYKFLYDAKTGKPRRQKFEERVETTSKKISSRKEKKKIRLAEHDLYASYPVKEVIKDHVEHKKITSLCSENERKFFVVLRSVLPDEYIIHCQTSLLAVVKPVNFKDMSRTWAKRVDFVVTDAYTNIVAVIELDDSSHNSEKRKKRDHYVDHALVGNHPLIRYKASFSYTEQEVIAKLKNETTLLV